MCIDFKTPNLRAFTPPLYLTNVKSPCSKVTFRTLFPGTSVLHLCNAKYDGVTVATDVSGRKLYWEPETWEFVEEIVGDFKF